MHIIFMIKMHGLRFDTPSLKYSGTLYVDSYHTFLQCPSTASASSPRGGAPQRARASAQILSMRLAAADPSPGECPMGSPFHPMMRIGRCGWRGRGVVVFGVRGGFSPRACCLGGKKWHSGAHATTTWGAPRHCGGTLGRGVTGPSRGSSKQLHPHHHHLYLHPIPPRRSSDLATRNGQYN